MKEDDMTPPMPSRDIANIADIERELTRLLAGELPPEWERELRARLEREPALAAEHRRLERAWSALEPGAVGPAGEIPPGFATRVMAQVRAEGRPGLSWSTAPAWARAAAAAALVGGVALGAGLGGTALNAFAAVPSSTPAAEEAQEEPDASVTGASLAESYWSLVEDVGGDSGSALEEDLQEEVL
jgi:anti-sigma factor RsiW